MGEVGVGAVVESEEGMEDGATANEKGVGDGERQAVVLVEELEASGHPLACPHHSMQNGVTRHRGRLACYTYSI